MRSTLLALLVAAVAATPAQAASSLVFGSDLVNPANFNQGCDTQPTIVDINGNYGPIPSNQPDCTWMWEGVPNSQPPRNPDFRGNTVPGDGTIVQAEVKSGPNPSPLRFVILRQIESVCCYFQRETEPVALTPNATTVVPLNLPVERNTIGGVIVYDKVAISAESGKGSLPMFTTGQLNTNAQLAPNNPDSDFWYPRMGSVPGDGTPGGGRPVGLGLPGTELLVRWTWNSVPDPVVPPPPSNTAPPPIGPVTVAPPPGTAPTTGSIAPALVNPTIRVANNRALIQLLCNGNATCAGQLDVVNRTAGTRARQALTPKRQPTVYGKAKYSIKPGKKAKVTVKLNAKGLALLKARRKHHLSLKLTLRLTPKGGRTTTKPVTFK